MKKAWHLFLVCGAALACVAARAEAAIIHVAAGEVVVNAGNHLCSLREAINNANTASDTSGGDCTAGDAGTNDIVLALSTYNLPDSAVSDVNFGDSGLPAITSHIEIKGNGATIQRSPALFPDTDPCNSASNFRLFFVGTNGNLTLVNVALHNGCAAFSGTGAGGAIFNRGTLTLIGATVSGNVASQSAGGIQNDGTLNLIESTVSANTVTEGAGGGIVNTNTFTSKQSTISGNTTAGAGGALYSPGTSTMGNSTISGNGADGTGGGLQYDAAATLDNVTVTGNATLAVDGGGIFRDAGNVTLGNTIAAAQLGGTDCFGTTSAGHNLDSDGTCATQASDLTAANPGLGPLVNNGGPTATHALLIGSPAIDHGDNAICAADPVNNIDQRGIARPQNGGISLTCDIGAFEFCLTCAHPAPAVSASVLAGLLLLLLASGLYRVRHLRTRS